MTTPTDPPPLALTGERTLPGIPDETYWFQRHVVAYDFAAHHVHGGTVLDAGCGEGYGLALLADAGAQRVVGVDLDAAVVAHAAAAYGNDTVEVVRAELMDLPLDADEVDLTVSFQVIEHLHDIPGYLASLVRVTRPGGGVIIATPNRLTFTPDSDTPVNAFHTREFTADELVDELTTAGLEVEHLLGVHHGLRLALVEIATQRRLTDLLADSAPEQWSAWLRRLVHRVRPNWFTLRGDRLESSLDLIAVCRVPEPPQAETAIETESSASDRPPDPAAGLPGAW